MSFGRVASSYVEQLEWHAFAVKPRGKAPLTRRGHLDATTDLEAIEKWDRKWPGANVAVSCAASGFLAFDVDPRNGGEAELDALTNQFGALPDTPTQLTGGGGFHFLFAAPRGLRWLPEIAPGLEIKHRGYIVVAPSIHPNGRPYAWEMSAHPLDIPLAPPPAWLVRLGGRLEARRRTAPEGELAETLLARGFHHAQMVRRQIDSVRIAVVCPWTAEHSTGAGSVTSTVVFAPRDRGGRGWFHCSHASCAGRRSRSDVVGALHDLAPDALRAASIEVGLLRAEAVQDDQAERRAIELEGA